MIVDLLDAFGILVDDALTGVGLAPDKVVRYHGRPPIQCCTEAGSLYSWWTPAYIGGVERFPARHPGGDLVGPQVWQLHVRWTRCFPTVADDKTFDEGRAAEIANDLAVGTQAVLCALAVETCRPTGEFRARCDGFQVNDIEVDSPEGGCAGVRFRVTVGTTRGCVPTDDNGGGEPS